jgi:hypothetical protein
MDAAPGGAVGGMLGWPAGLRDPFRQLLVQPTLVACLNDLIGPGFRLDRQPELFCDRTRDPAAPLSGGNEPRDPGSAYYFRNGNRHCQRILVLWALAEAPAGAGGFAFVPNSHRVQVEAPAGLAGGADGMGVLARPALAAGDCLLVAGSCLHGLRPWRHAAPHRLLCYEFVGRGVLGAIGPGPLAQRPPAPDASLSAEQRALLYAPDYAGSQPPPAVVTDGERVRLDAARAVFHPSLYTDARDPTISQDEFFFWELNGYLILKGVMDPGWVRAANAAVDSVAHTAAASEELSGGAPGLAGGPQSRIGGLLDLPEPHRAPFARMLAHPVVQHRLNWMGGSGMRSRGRCCNF